MYLSNAEKEALFLTGYGDVPPWAVQQGLEQALARGAYVPGEEALRIRLADALDLEERLATAGGKTTEQQAEELQESADVDIIDLAMAAAYNEMASYVAEGFQQGLLEGREGEHHPFSSFTKAQLLTFAADHFGVQLKLADSKDELIAQVQRLVDEANEKAV